MVCTSPWAWEPSWWELEELVEQYCKYKSHNGKQVGLCLVRFNSTVNTIRLYWCVQTVVLSGNHKAKSAVLFRLLTQTIEAPKKRNRTVRVTNILKRKKRKRTIVNKVEIKLQFLCGTHTEYFLPWNMMAMAWQYDSVKRPIEYGIVSSFNFKIFIIHDYAMFDTNDQNGEIFLTADH